MYAFLTVFVHVALALSSVLVCLAVVAQFYLEITNPNRSLHRPDDNLSPAAPDTTTTDRDTKRAWCIIGFVTLLLFMVIASVVASYIPISL